MKKRIFRGSLLAVIALLAAAVFCGCQPPPEEHVPVVTVTTLYDTANVRDTEVADYDYTYMFSIVSDGKPVKVLPEHIDSSEVLSVSGTYPVYCRYGGKSAQATVHVSLTVTTLELSRSAITLVRSDVKAYDFRSLFVAKRDGIAVDITDDMVTTDVTDSVGEYTYTVKFGSQTATLKVTVIDNVIIVPSYTVKEIETSALEDHDYTEFFALYVDGKPKAVTKEMLDLSAIAGASTGDSVQVGMSYEHNGETRTASVKVNVVADAAYAVSARSVNIPVHSENIDLTKLFDFSRGKVKLPVTMDMISGAVDYSNPGSYEIVFDHAGKTATATVTISDGLLISATKGTTVYIKKGTNKAEYSFMSDFDVTINGVEYFAIPDAYLSGVDDADFDTVGMYDVTLTVLYNTDGVSWGDQTFNETKSLTIKYDVRDKVGTAQIKSELVELPLGATYNVFDNVAATVNGVPQRFTQNPQYVTPITCYGKALSEPLDNTSSEVQHVKLEAYVFGNDASPITLEYDVVFKSNVKITATDRGVFSGATVFATDLFTLTVDGKPVKVTYDMIQGKVDTLKPGVSRVTLSYGGVSATASVTVFDSNILGVYKTKLTTIPLPQEDDDDDDYGDPGWGDEGWGEYSLGGGGVMTSAAEISAVTQLGDLVISDDGSITVNGVKATLVGGLDENTLIINIRSYEHTLYYNDGIIVLDPDNSLKLGFHEGKRPLVYFRSDIWDIEETVAVLYGSESVLTTTNVGAYDLNTFHITKKADSTDMWYGLYIRLAEKTSSDTVYTVGWGEAVFADGFVPRKDVQSSVTFGGETIRFTMTDGKTAKVLKNSDMPKKYANMLFSGVIDGKAAKLVVNSAENFTIKIDDKTVASVTQNDISGNKNSYVDYDTDTVFLYNYRGDYKFSYKFVLDVENSAFEVAPHDAYYGLYECDNMYIYLDGYGTGVINFDNKSYIVTQFTYEVKSGVAVLEYFGTSPTFGYGKTAEFYMGEFLNTLTTKSFATDMLSGKTFENSIITDGAIIKIGSYRFGAGSTAKTEIISAITIKTAQGTLDDGQKAPHIDLDSVNATTAGFYRFGITVEVGGENKTSYYSIQIVKGQTDALYKTYGQGLLGKNNDIAIDANGQIMLKCGNTVYSGFAKVAEAGSRLTFKAYGARGEYVFGELKVVQSSLVTVTCRGAVSYSDYYAPAGTSSTRVAARLGIALREITVSGTKIYVLSGSELSVGDIVTVTNNSGAAEIVNGDTVTVNKPDGSSLNIRILKWDDVKEGLMIV